MRKSKHKRKIPEGQEDVVGESAVVTYLSRRGFHVYRNMSGHGCPDLITYRPGNRSIKKIEVTTDPGNRHRSDMRHWDYLAVVDVDRATLKVNEIVFLDHRYRDWTRHLIAGHGWRKRAAK